MRSNEWLLRLRSAQAFRPTPLVVPLSGGRLQPASSPAPGVVQVQDVRRREGNNPQSDDQRADGEDPLAGGAIMGGEARRLADTEDLPADSDGHQKGTENEREPSHGVPLYPIQDGCGKRQSGGSGEVPDTAREATLPEVIA